MAIRESTFRAVGITFFDMIFNPHFVMDDVEPPRDWYSRNTGSIVDFRREVILHIAVGQALGDLVSMPFRCPLARPDYCDDQSQFAIRESVARGRYLAVATYPRRLILLSRKSPRTYGSFRLLRRGSSLVAVEVQPAGGQGCGSSRWDRHTGALLRLCGRPGIGSGPCRPGQAVRGLLCRAAFGRGPEKRRTIGGSDCAGANGGATPIAAPLRGTGTLV